MDYYSANNHYTTNKTDAFSIASFVCGTIALVTLCTAVIPIPFGALGTLFAILTYRKGKPLSPYSKIGLWLSVGSLILGIIYTAYVTITVVIPLYNDPTFIQQLNTYYEAIYGISYEEFMDLYFNL